jgi:hypothetical protein
LKGSTTIERCAASAAAPAFEATGVGANVATGADRFASRKYQTPAATNTIDAAKPTPSGARDERRFGWADFACHRLVYIKRIDPDGIGDILELRRAEVCDGEIEPPFDLPVGLLGQTDSARLGNPLQSRGDVHPVAHQIAVGLLDNVAEVNADAELDAALGRQAGIALDEALLHFDGAAHGVDHAAKLDETAVAGSLDDGPVMRVNAGSIRSLRSPRSRESVRSSSAPARRL